MLYGCYRGHVTEAEDAGDYICCPVIEQVKTHYNCGKICGRLAFRGKVPKDVDKPEESKV